MPSHALIAGTTGAATLALMDRVPGLNRTPPIGRAVAGAAAAWAAGRYVKGPGGAALAGIGASLAVDALFELAGLA